MCQTFQLGKPGTMSNSIMNIIAQFNIRVAAAVRRQGFTLWLMRASDFIRSPGCSPSCDLLPTAGIASVHHHTWVLNLHPTCHPQTSLWLPLVRVVFSLLSTDRKCLIFSSIPHWFLRTSKLGDAHLGATSSPVSEACCIQFHLLATLQNLASSISLFLRHSLAEWCS